MEIMAIELSIIIPIYNAEKVLKRCIDSVLKQTFGNFELILVNDGSTDLSLDICNKYKNFDKRIKVIHTDNRGASAARNIGLEAAEGTYIQFIDADDYIAENMCERMVKALKSSNADMCLCGYNIISNENFVKKTSLFEKEGEINNLYWELYRLSGITYLWNKLFIKEKIQEKFDEDTSFGEDLCFILHYLKNNRKIKCISDELYFYNTSTEGSLSKNYESIIRFLPDTMNVTLEFFDDLNMDSTLLKDEYYKKILRYTTKFYLSNNNRKACKQYFRRLVGTFNLINCNMNYKSNQLKVRVIQFLIRKKCAFIFCTLAKVKARSR